MKNVRGDGILIIPVIIKYMTVSSITAEENSHDNFSKIPKL